ncbi:MAG: AAA family ATPase [Planctomycetes bacterium]|nr:AAA family ATPase [Planctomycetota bacterium]
MLFMFGGLPGTGKSTLSCHLACSLGAVHLRIDTSEESDYASDNGQDRSPR